NGRHGSRSLDRVSRPALRDRRRRCSCRFLPKAGSIALKKPARAGGKHCRSVLPVTAIPRISGYHLLGADHRCIFDAGSTSSSRHARPTVRTVERTIRICPKLHTNTVVYTGTHDNPTTRSWFDKYAVGLSLSNGSAV